jgi:hypothetical protein
MSVTVCLPLFGPPGRELEEGRALRGPALRQLADGLHQRLLHAADLLDRFTAAGWGSQVAMYDVILTRDDVQTREQALLALAALEVDPEELMIVEDVDEEDED